VAEIPRYVFNLSRRQGPRRIGGSQVRVITHAGVTHFLTEREVAALKEDL